MVLSLVKPSLSVPESLLKPVMFGVAPPPPAQGGLGMTNVLHSGLRAKTPQVLEGDVMAADKIFAKVFLEYQVRQWHRFSQNTIAIFDSSAHGSSASSDHIGFRLPSGVSMRGIARHFLRRHASTGQVYDIEYRNPVQLRVNPNVNAGAIIPH
jgi:hypothetical protein